MQRCFGYIRVSTTRQGEQGVSLQEQRTAIERYARQHDLTIISWYEEQETAAKRGRPKFNQMIKLLRQHKAEGVIIHKIDRSARNLRDWADLTELMDEGVRVHVAHESLDLTSRSGRLSADIQAVFATDYIRNLRDEARKGFYGRLKQGIYPLSAPTGYVDRGGGQLKEVHPVMGPLVRRGFELYDTGRYSIESLGEELVALGLRTRKGKPLSRNRIWEMLRNPFYIGLIHIRTTGETFEGAHQPLISKALFDRVQERLHGKAVLTTEKHVFAFRRLLRCATCHRSLIGERQKGHTYYRCHSATCPSLCLREEAVDSAFREVLRPLVFSKGEEANLLEAAKAVRASWFTRKKVELEGVRSRLGAVNARLTRLTDALLDDTIDKVLFEERRGALLHEKRALEERLSRLEGQDGAKSVEPGLRLISFAKQALFVYDLATPEEKRELVRVVTSNREVSLDRVAITLDFPFSAIAERSSVSLCGQGRDNARTSLSHRHKVPSCDVGKDTARIPGRKRRKDPRATMIRLLEIAAKWLTDHPERMVSLPTHLRSTSRSAETQADARRCISTDPN
jgi:site-specific DNA recombinase